MSSQISHDFSYNFVDLDPFLSKLCTVSDVFLSFISANQSDYFKTLNDSNYFEKIRKHALSFHHPEDLPNNIIASFIGNIFCFKSQLCEEPSVWLRNNKNWEEIIRNPIHKGTFISVSNVRVGICNRRGQTVSVGFQATNRPRKAFQIFRKKSAQCWQIVQITKFSVLGQ